MKIKSTIFALIALFVAQTVFSESKEISLSSFGNNFEGNEAITIFYQENVCPGDAVFVRLCAPLNVKGNMSALLSFSKDGKSVGKTAFYEIPDNSEKKRTALLAGLPLSSYLTAGKGVVTIDFSINGIKKSESISINVVKKEFVSETIQLDARNTAIKTNDSDERWKQIKKLNKILETRNETAVRSLLPMLPPTKATRRTSFFADRRVYAYTNGKSSTSLHYGIDYGVPEGSEVRACASGKVVLAEFRISTGYSTVIEHLPGLYSLYYHQKELKVKEGDIVKCGDLIGLSGKTGLATGPHLHWEMRLNMEAVSPDFFTGDFTFEKAATNR